MRLDRPCKSCRLVLGPLETLDVLQLLLIVLVPDLLDNGIGSSVEGALCSWIPSWTVCSSLGETRTSRDRVVLIARNVRVPDIRHAPGIAIKAEFLADVHDRTVSGFVHDVEYSSQGRRSMRHHEIPSCRSRRSEEGSRRRVRARVF